MQREATVAPASSLVLSEEGLQKIQTRIDELRLDLGAVVALLLDDSGQLLTDCGWRGDFDIEAFLALLSNEMSAANAVVHLLRDDAAFDLHFHEGQKYEMYTARITDQVFLSLIFEARQNASGRVGMVWLTLRRAIAELRKMLRRAALRPGTAEDRVLHNTVSAALGEAIEHIEDDPLLRPKTETPAPPPPPRTDAPAPAPKLSRRHPRADADANRVLSYDEARALGLIGGDEEKQ